MFDILMEAWKRPGSSVSPIYRLKLSGDSAANIESEISRLHKCGVNSLMIYTECEKLEEGVVKSVFESAKLRYMIVYADESCICADTGCSDFKITESNPLFAERSLAPHGYEKSLYDEEVSIFSNKTIAPLNVGAGSNRIDVLNPYACDAYLYGTFDAFFSKHKDFVGDVLAGVVTDRLESVIKRNNIIWTYDLEQEFYSAGGDDRMLLSILSSTGDKRVEKEAKRIYWSTIASRVEKSFTIPLSQRCIKLNVDLCGRVPYELTSSSGRHFTLPIVSASKLPKDADKSMGTYVKAVSDISRHNGGKGAAFAIESESMSTEETAIKAIDAALHSAAKVILPDGFFDEEKLSIIKLSPADLKMFCEFVGRYFTLNSACRVFPNSRNAVLTDDEFIPFSGYEKLASLGIECNFISKSQLMDRAHIHNGEINIDKYSYTTLFIDPRIRLSPEEVMKIGRFAADGGKMFRGSGFDKYVKNIIKDKPCALPKGIDCKTTIKSGITFTHLANHTRESALVALPVDSKNRYYLLDANDGRAFENTSRNGEYSFYIPALSSIVVAIVSEKIKSLPDTEKLEEIQISEIVALNLGENTLPRAPRGNEIAVLEIDSIDGEYCDVTAGSNTIKLIHRPFIARLPKNVNFIKLESDGNLRGARVEIFRIV